MDAPDLGVDDKNISAKTLLLCGANGWGTTSAMIQAYVLSGEIATWWRACQDSGKVLSFQDPAQKFERIIRPIIKDRPSIAPKIMLPDTRFGIWALHGFFWLLTTLKVERFISLFLPSEGGHKLQYKDYFGLRSQYGV